MGAEEADEDVTRAAVAAAIDRAVAEGKSVESLGEAIGKSRQAVNLYRNRVHSIPLDSAVLLAAELGVNLTELAGVERLPDRSQELAAQILEAAGTQATIADELLGIARDVARLAGRDLDDSGTG